MLLVRPAQADAAVIAALVRIQGELIADGFEVTTTEAPQGSSSADAMTTADQNQASATIGLFLNPDGQSAELWVVDQVTHKTVVRHVDTQTQSTDELATVLAVRAVELLRASLLESLVSHRPDAKARHAEREPAPRTPPPIERMTQAWATRPLQHPASPNVGLHLGLSVLWHPGELAPAAAPEARFEWFAHPILYPRVTFVGLGMRPTVSGPSGEAAVAQGYGLAEVVLRPWPAARLSPTFSMGVGPYRASVEGRASWPYEGNRFARLSLVTGAGIGLTIALSQSLAIAAEQSLLLAMPHPEIRFAGTPVARLGLPLASSSLTLRVSL